MLRQSPSSRALTRTPTSPHARLLPACGTSRKKNREWKGAGWAGRVPARKLDTCLRCSEKGVELAGPDYTMVQRNLALELVRVTEAAALAAAKWLGKGDKNAADQAAVDMMRKVLNSIQMDGVVVIGEGEKDEAPMLYQGERIGMGGIPKVEIAVDPLDGTTLTAQGRDGAITVIALAEPGTLLDPGPCTYMEKLTVGPGVNPSAVGLRFTPTHNIKALSRELKKPVDEVTVLILDRPRHKDLIAECREAGARIKLISDGDVAGAIEVAKAGAPADMMLGTGGSPEGIIAAAALRCMGGYMEGRLFPRNEQEKAKAELMKMDTSRIYRTDELCKGQSIFFAATGVSNSDLVKGVRFYSGGASTNSIVMRVASGTVRYVETFHKWEHTRPVENINFNGVFSFEESN